MWVYTCCFLLVSTYLYRYGLCFVFFLICCCLCWECSAPSRGEGNSKQWLAQIYDCRRLTHILNSTHTTLHIHTQHTLGTQKNCCCQPTKRKPSTVPENQSQPPYGTKWWN